MKKKALKKCKQCNKEASSGNKWTWYCSKRCRNTYDKVRKVREARGEKQFVEKKYKPDISQYKNPIAGKVKSGYGYYGILTNSKNGEMVQCHECGEWLRFITNSHINSHGINSVNDYKFKYGLSKRTSLASRKYIARLRKQYNKVARKFSEQHKKNASKENIERLIESNKARKGEKLALEIKNKRGTCRVQLIEKIKEVANINSTEFPTRKMFFDCFHSKYINAVYAEFGNWVEAVKASGFTPISLIKKERYSDNNLIADLVKFYSKYGRTPQTSDFRSRPELADVNVYIKRFSKLNNARRLAEVPILVNVGNNDCWAEVTPEEYLRRGSKYYEMSY